MTVHNETCEDFNYFVHWATGGDGKCVCDQTPEQVAGEYSDILFGTEEDLLTFAAELGIDIDESRDGVIG